MSSTSERQTNEQTRTYDRASSVVFLKTDAPFGGLSNMAGGFPLYVQGTRIYTSEALYQACRFPHLPEVQRLIIGQASPMTAKMKSKPHRKDSRPDWDRVRVKVMRWCLRVKLVQNWAKFSELLLRTGDRPIVEESRRDDFWGAKPVDEQTLVGMNVLGRLLMELREAVKSQGRDAFLTVEPPDIPEFLFLGRPITAIGESELTTGDSKATPAPVSSFRRPVQDGIDQPALFDVPSAREAPWPVYVTQKAPGGAPLGDLKPYPAMKDSGVPWLGEVPEHWVVRRGKWLFRTKKELNSDLRNTNVLSLTLRGVVNNDPNDPEGLVPKDYGTYQLFAKNDLVFKLIDLENLRTSRVGLVHEDGIMSPAYVRLVQAHSEVQPYYFRQYFDLYQRGIFNQLGGGVRSTLSAKDLLEVPVLSPTGDEQAAIVRFLDHADRRIRRYIRAKQKLIKLLEEQKQAIIHRAVTRGLDPNVRLKPSGVEWLGDVPEHWNVVPLKRLGTVRIGLTYSPGDVCGDSGTLVLRASNVSNGRVVHADNVRVSKKIPNTLRVREGDILVCVRSGSRSLVGKSALITKEFEGASYGAFMSLLRTMDNKFYFRVLHSNLLPTVMAQFETSTINQLTQNDLRSLVVPVPPNAERAAITDFLDSETTKADRAIAAATAEINLLREYRTRLIADVVTGKLDVREAASRLPQEVEDLEPLGETEVEGDAEETDSGDGDGVPEEVET